MSQTNGKKAKTSKLDNAEDFWTKLNAEMSDEDITRMHKQIVRGIILTILNQLGMRNGG